MGVPQPVPTPAIALIMHAPVLMVTNAVSVSQVQSIALQRIFHVEKKMLDTAALVPTILDMISLLTQMALMNVLIKMNVFSHQLSAVKVTVSTKKEHTHAHVSLVTISSSPVDLSSPSQPMLKVDSRHHKVADLQLVSPMITGKCLPLTRLHLNLELVDDHPNSNAVTKTNVKLVTTIALMHHSVVFVPILKVHTHAVVLLDSLVMVPTRTSTML